MIKIAKRENNTKRSFLVLNTDQCKHVPCSPSKALNMFDSLADKLTKYKDEKLLFIGFAETATAIGFHIASRYNQPYITTTRENIEGREYVFFEEKHSHATDQRIDKAYLDKMIPRIDRIVFVEDELSTGSTILNCIKELKKLYARYNIKFAVCSLVNGMSDENLARYNTEGIDLFYIIKQDNSTCDDKIKDFVNNGTYIKTSNVYDLDLVKIGEIILKEKPNGGISNIHNLIEKTIQEIEPFCTSCNNSSKLLFLGTEEFMYPAIAAGQYFESLYDCEVLSHSTTRSPICVSNNQGYPLSTRFEIPSLYGDYKSYIYNLGCFDKVFIISDFTKEQNFAYLLNALQMCGNKDIIVIQVKYEYDKVTSSYSSDDVTVLLKDLTGKISPESTEEREKKIQSGVHYSEMLPLEYKPTDAYMQIYNEMLEKFKQKVADSVAILADKLYKAHGSKLVLVSLARAGLPIGVLLKRYIELKYNVNVSHYAVSIIRGKGIDKNALNYILKYHNAEDIQFVDGWTGKGAITNQLKEALEEYPNISNEIAVIADPAYITTLCGTHEDILIPSSCLNSTVSGLLSRTILRDDLVEKDDFHGVVYFSELIDDDLSMNFIETIEKCFRLDVEDNITNDLPYSGYDEVVKIAEDYNVKDINFVKPGIGETTRVLLRRVPDVILIDKESKDDIDLQHIYRLAKDKKVKVEYYNMNCYKCCGIIKNLKDV